jgi:membrane-bound lytic murein transglycosylase F
MGLTGLRRPPCLVLLMVAFAGIGVVAAAAVGDQAPPLSGYEKYDEHFKKYSERFFGGDVDWRLFKAQAIVESNLKPNAVNPSGARGVMQLMSPTYAEARRRNKDFGDISNPEWNIAAGIWYAHEQWNSWESDAEKKFRKQFMLGSYNAGRGTLVRAQKVALSEKLNHKRWPTIEKVAPRVPNWRYKETLAYVGSVFANMSSMDRKGRVKGPTISKDPSGGGLPDKLKSFLGLFKHLRLWDDD